VEDKLDKSIDAMREKIVRLGGMLFDRFLTDAAGGNISARVGDVICITSRYSGQKYQWQIRPEQVLVVDADGKILDGEGDISRESKVHLRLYKEFGMTNGIVHCHPRNVLVFCAAGKPIQPVLEATWKFGEIKVVPYAPAHSAELANSIVETIRGQEERIKKHAAAVIARWHGLFVVGKDVDAAFDAAERIDNNARIIMTSQAVETKLALADEWKAALARDLADE
jgi:L-fuculose-phosphate aldolase